MWYEFVFLIALVGGALVVAFTIDPNVVNGDLDSPDDYNDKPLTDALDLRDEKNDTTG